MKYVFKLFLLLFLQIAPLKSASWFTHQTRHFIIIYKPAHEHLVEHLATASEDALKVLMRLFDYSPTEKIIINTYDFSDYGAAGTTTLPQNYIRLQIGPLELGYEVMPFTDRFQWLINHELVHVVVNDKTNSLESLSRKIFSKVPPENAQPLTILYSLVTNHDRYTPRWHQEGIAVFLETWLSGGYGRVLGNFDEMYFRSLVAMKQGIPDLQHLDSKESYTSFLVETLFYLYGGRFATYLAVAYSPEKLLAWYTPKSKDFYLNFAQKFKNNFGISLEKAWQDFTKNEKTFQESNLKKLQSAPLTPIEPLFQIPLGWVTPAYLDSTGQTFFFADHQPHHLTAINQFDLKTKQIEKIGSIPGPSLFQIGSTAFDPSLNLFFYSTNNNNLYRDLFALNPTTKKKKLLFKDARVGQITVSRGTHELWGIRHQAGKSSLVYSAYPYRGLLPMVDFGIENNLQHLAISPDGKILAATLHQSTGEQKIIVADIDKLKNGGNFTFKVINAEGSPEYPAWNPDGNQLYWDSYTNGVANIYRYDLTTAKTEPMSHNLTGLFKPMYLNPDSLLTFQFTPEGFRPVIIPNKPARRLPAIRYYGQQIFEQHPEITRWIVQQTPFKNNSSLPAVQKKPYKALRHLKFHSFIPVLSGFQAQKVVGFYTHLSDPLFVHDFTMEIGMSVRRQNALTPNFHLKGKYEFKRRFRLGMEHNAANFYDLLNHRKQGMIGNRFTFGHTKFWKYDIPHKIKQVSEIAVYTGVVAINDNLVKVFRPDFVVLQSALNSSNVRRSIGSVDYESGNQWAVTGMFFGVEPRDLQTAGGIHAEYDRFVTWGWPHNSFHLKLAAGWRKTRHDMAIGKFYFGGFGNRYLDPAPVKQYRKVFRFPGIPIYSLPTNRFLKIMLEQNLPPLRFAHAYLGHHNLSHIDLSGYSQSLLVHSENNHFWIDLGAQINFHFKHWYNLDSTISAGAAKAWYEKNSSQEWFISLKLMK